jgi:hypothetical protein
VNGGKKGMEMSEKRGEDGAKKNCWIIMKQQKYFPYQIPLLTFTF